MNVPMYDFGQLHHAEFKAELKKRISDIIDNNAFVEGPYNFSFEEKFAKMQNAKHCLLVANGTDALEISLAALDIGPGDKVGVPGITFYATAEAVLNVGAEPVFIDVLPETGLMDPASLDRLASTHKMKAVMPVHIYGMTCDMNAIGEVCKKHQIEIVEDAAQAHGGLINGKPVGNTGNLTTFSFYPTKNLSAFGDAGCILTNDDNLATIIKTIRNHGRGDAARLGRNSRCDHIQAAVLDLKLEEIEKFNQNKKEIAKKYHKALAGMPFKLVPDWHLDNSAFHLYPIYLKDSQTREKLQSHLSDNNIGSAPFYMNAMIDEKALSGYEGESEVARDLAGRVLCLPIHPFISDEDINYVKEKISEFFNS